MAKTKKPICLSFSGESGRKAKEILDNSENKSKLVVELLLIYNEAANKYGKDEAIFELKNLLKKRF